MRITTATGRRPNGKRWRNTYKKVWFANGIHHHYSNDKFVPEFPKEYFLAVAESIPVEKFGDELNALRAVVCEAIFNPNFIRLNSIRLKVRIWWPLPPTTITKA